MPNSRSAAHDWERQAIFIFGIAFVVVLIILAIFFPNPTAFQYVVFRAVLALAAAGVAALIPGLLNVDLPAVRAGGALAVFVLIFYFSPAALIVPPPLAPPLVAIPASTPAPTPLPVVTYKICEGEYERNCSPHDVYQYCYVTPQSWAQGRCTSFTVQRLDTRGGNKCGYSLDLVICTGPK